MSTPRSADAFAASPAFATIAVAGIGEIAEGDDLAAVLVNALAARGERPADGDILVIASKVVSKAEGRRLAALDRDRVERAG